MSTKFIVREQLNSALLRIIESATVRVELISPYLDPSEHQAKAIERQVLKGIPVSLCFRQDKEKEYEDVLQRFLKIGVACYSVPNLHAKIYRNEKHCLVTSMNLTKSSAINSEECGIYTDDPDLIREMDEFVTQLKQMSRKLSGPSLVKKVASGVRKVTSVIDDLTQTGYCIRCHDRIDWNTERPLCPDCYREWAKYKKPDYAEKFCHKCGQERKTSLARPLCGTCFKES